MMQDSSVFLPQRERKETDMASVTKPESGRKTVPGYISTVYY